MAPGQSASKDSKEALAAQLQADVKAWNDWRSTPAADATLDLSDANFYQCDLTGANLVAVNLSNSYLSYAKLARGTNLWNSNLSNSSLDHADLRGANLSMANFTGATLSDADLRDSNLSSADLSNVRGGLLPRQLAGADLTGAKLPEPLVKLYDKLGSVGDISDSAKKLFLALLAACLYSWLTIATTKDVDLITNRASSPLPVIQTAIPIVGFYVVAPLILLCIYFYFHFYLQKLWEELATLPAVFTDGRPLYARADPWLFNDLVRAHFPRLKEGRPFLSYFQQWISILLAWWIVPVTLLLFWGRYLPRHDLFWTIVLALLLAISIVSAIRLYQLASSTLRGDPRLSLAETVKSRHPYIILLLVAVCSATFVMMSLGAIDGIPPRAAHSYRSPQTWVPLAMSWVGYDPFANLANADISIKPSDWTGKNDDELDKVKGADLRGRDLRYAVGNNVFLAKARLNASDLRNVSFDYSDLRQADLTSTSLSGASLYNAQMQGAQLDDAELSGVDWLSTRIEYADLRRTHDLDTLTIRAAPDWQLALYDPKILQQLGLPPDHNEALEDYQESNSQEDFDSWIVKWRKEKQAK